MNIPVNFDLESFVNSINQSMNNQNVLYRNIVTNLNNLDKTNRQFVQNQAGQTLTVTIPNSIKRILVTMVAGGGAGGNGLHNNLQLYSGGGGGSGECVEQLPLIIKHPNASVSLYAGFGGNMTHLDGTDSYVQISYRDYPDDNLTYKVKGGQGAGQDNNINGGLCGYLYGHPKRTSCIRGCESGEDGQILLPSMGSVMGGDGGDSSFADGGEGGLSADNSNNENGQNGVDGSGGGGSVPITNTNVSNGGNGFVLVEW